MRRKLFNLAAAVSVVLFVTMARFCVRSQFQPIPYIEFTSKEPPLYGRFNTPNTPSARTDTLRGRAFEAWDRQRWRVHVRANPNGIFAFGRQPFYGYPANGFGIHFYYAVWLPALTVLPAVFVWRRWRSSTRPPGHCPTCGYDCRATPRKCPECGTELADAATATSQV